ncbi:MAG: hypothetical protein WKG32_06180 [Gemmatimonadaceae bacterium]
MSSIRLSDRLAGLGAAAIASVLLACADTNTVPQPAGADEQLVTELAAARHMRETYPGQPLALDPAFQRPVDAPGWPSAGRRDSARTAALARELGARITSDRAGGGIYLLLSEPVVRGDTAAVTVTAAWSGDPRRSGYETRALTLVRERGAWRVVGYSQLGIS